MLMVYSHAMHMEQCTRVLQDLLAELRGGTMSDISREEEAIGRIMHEIFDEWDQLFPGFPESALERRSACKELMRGRRDKYLIDVIAKTLKANSVPNGLILNPACVFGRHAMKIARRLPECTVIGSDIDALKEAVYRNVVVLLSSIPKNYRFERDDVFQSTIQEQPTAVVFFGACGSVSDAAMDLAIKKESPYLICRTCCHDNIGGNTCIAKKASLLNYFHRLKNWYYRRRKKSKAGDYFSDKYSSNAYPRSTAARQLLSGEEYFEAARNCVNSDICRFIIDIDRCLYLQENGYQVSYKEELFFASKSNKKSGR